MARCTINLDSHESFTVESAEVDDEGHPTELVLYKTDGTKITVYARWNANIGGAYLIIRND